MSENFTVKSKIRDYEVEFPGDIMDALKAEVCSNSFFLIDQNIVRLYQAKILSLLPDKSVITIQAKESNKSIEYCSKIIELLIKSKIRKSHRIVAIGGGIVQDIAAFISSILFRGINWVFVPTTLLAQADSCIGGKTSINFNSYKNLLGNFYPPQKIYIDLSFLDTLPIEEIKSGIGEMLHFYLLAGSKLTDKIFINYETLIASPVKLRDYVKNSLLIKKKTVEADEFDKNIRNIFNYGHTFGHAIETVSKYRINHGQAVTMGMDIANYVSCNFGFISKKTFDAMHLVLSKNSPRYKLDKNSIDDYLAALAKDKKNIGDKLGCVLTHGPGEMELVQVPFDNKLRGVILSYFQPIK